ncbi:purine-nucleoside phosphorylase [Salana multivorans]|uniref:purine-nucleoside phosphorylase n=1 Tax=Salana multivorans TaxID=120377 RepID=A0A3N2D088_9MICO|nr:purine-nucleoside phosphorylase [Salana multivorans]ROR93192.1 purine-nucleoside phosphorylase [Salana multivorans]
MTPEEFPAALLTAADRAAADVITAAAGGRLDALVVLGSGLAEITSQWSTSTRGVLASARLSELPGVLAPAADGHEDRWDVVDLAGRRVLVTSGRTHLYEGVERPFVTALVRIAAAAGASRVVLTNANGCLRDWRLGDVVTIVDHLNLTGSSPFDGTVFLDPRGVWDRTLAAATASVTHREGTYAQLRGPEYQTMAETRLLAASGVDVVGMSTVHEALMAAALGLRVAGLSVVSDLSFATEPVGSDTVLAAAASSRETLRRAIEEALASE